MSDVVLIWFFYLAFCAGVSHLAKTYGRSRVAWFCLAFFLTPLISFIFLIVARIPARPEEAEKQVSEDIEQCLQEDEKFDYAEGETKCSQCGASINIHTRKGISLPDEEVPWDMRCALCGGSISVDSIEPNP